MDLLLLCTRQQICFQQIFSIPSQRNRVLGYQLYKYNVKGFLHWGYNFWNTQYSKKKSILMK